ncbi:hypothetical protein BDY21DRAFT_382731 [Lineolata rhizophorae]|uniref:Uncharacterized protein n=1 Tax=Lineolata rhizophorae TaxID=578093 RepID=A0A6A6NLL3_9PEZI|nr:hypothetical protein BDY21DRAFT_382731 [Lineolata rhizophorae]
MVALPAYGYGFAPMSSAEASAVTYDTPMRLAGSGFRNGFLLVSIALITLAIVCLTVIVFLASTSQFLPQTSKIGDAQTRWLRVALCITIVYLLLALCTRILSELRVTVDPLFSLMIIVATVVRQLGDMVLLTVFDDSLIAGLLVSLSSPLLESFTFMVLPKLTFFVLACLSAAQCVAFFATGSEADWITSENAMYNALNIAWSGLVLAWALKLVFMAGYLSTRARQQASSRRGPPARPVRCVGRQPKEEAAHAGVDPAPKRPRQLAAVAFYGLATVLLIRGVAALMFSYFCGFRAFDVFPLAQLLDNAFYLAPTVLVAAGLLWIRRRGNGEEEEELPPAADADADGRRPDDLVSPATVSTPAQIRDVLGQTERQFANRSRQIHFETVGRRSEDSIIGMAV